MNRIYRLVWSRKLNALVVGSEFASSRCRLSASGTVGHVHAPKALGLLGLGLGAILGAGPVQAAELDNKLGDLQALVAKYSDQNVSTPFVAPLDANAGIRVASPSRPPGASAGAPAAAPAIVQARPSRAVATPTRTVARVAPVVAPARPLLDLGADLDASVVPLVVNASAALSAAVPVLASVEAAASGSADVGVLGTGNTLVAVADRNIKHVAAPAALPVPAALSLDADADASLDVAGLVGADAAISGSADVNLLDAGDVIAAVADRNIKHVAAAVALPVPAALSLDTDADASLDLAGLASVGLSADAEVSTAVAAAGLIDAEISADLSAQIGLGSAGAVDGLVGGAIDTVHGVVHEDGLVGGVIGSVTGVTGDGLVGGVVDTVHGVVHEDGLVGGVIGSVTGATGDSLVGGVIDKVTGVAGEGGLVGGVIGSVTGATGDGLVGGVVDTVHEVVNEDGLVGGVIGSVTGAAGDGLVGGVVDTVHEVVNEDGLVGGVIGSVTGATDDGLVGGVVDTVHEVVNEDGLVGGVIGSVTGATGDGLVGGVVDTVHGVVGEDGLVGDAIGTVTGAADEGGLVGGVVDTVTGVTGDVLDGVTDGSGTTGGLGQVLEATTGTVTETLDGVLTGDAVDTLGQQLSLGSGNLLSGSLLGIGTQSIPPESPKYPVAPDPNAGLIIGTGGLVGGLTELVGPTGEDLLGGDGYVRNGNLAVSNYNVMQTYSVTNVLGIPVVNLSPTGTVLDGLGGATTGGSSHLTLLGGVTSDSYIYNINNGNPGGLLGLLLPTDSPDWAGSCLDALGVVSIDCWAVNAAQDYQVLVGDGAYANGSKEVVVGANARHQLPQQDANDAFPGAGVNDPTDPTGVPTADYAARMGHSVVVGDSALGTANGQTILGAEATSNQANSVALGYRSNAARGAQASYTAYGLTAPQVSSGEVAVGFAGGERQITHVAAGSVATDAVNVAQLQGAISLIGSVDSFAVTYDDDGTGAPNYSRVTLGNGAGPTTVANLAAGEVSASSSDAINGAQLYGASQSVATHLGGGAAVGADGFVTAPSYTINSVGTDGQVSPGSYDNVGSAFDAVSQSLANTVDQIGEVDALAVKYDADAQGDASNHITLTGDGSGAAVGITNLAAGAVSASSSDAVNGAQLFGTNAALVDYFGGTTAFDPATGAWTAPTFDITSIGADGSTTPGSYDNATDAFAAVDGSLTSVNQQITDIRNGVGSKYVKINSLKAEANAAGGDSVAIGPAASAAGAASLALGDAASAGADGSVALGAGAVADRAGTVSVGSAGNERQIVNVADATQATDAVNLRQLQASEEGALRYDTHPDGSIDYGHVTLGDGTGPTTVANLAAGEVSASSSDAINGAQLYGASQSVATHLGGGAAVGADGFVTAPSYTINSVGTDGQVSPGNYDNVGSAFDAVSQSLANTADQVEEVGKLAVKYDADAQGDASNSITLTGDGSGAAVAITNLAEGSVAAGSSEAITGNQLFATNAALSSYFGGSTSFDGTTALWTAPAFHITSIASDGSSSAADYDNVTAAFTAVDGSLVNINQRIDQLQPGGGSQYVQVNSSKGAASASGADSVAIGPVASASGDGSVALGDGASASAGNSVALGAGSVASVGAQQGYTGAYVQPGSSNSSGEVAVGASGAERKVTHVADGSERYDAVNVGQLQAGVNHAIDASKAYTDTQIDNINNGTSGMFQVNNSQALAQPAATGSNSAAGGAGASASGSDSTALGNGAQAQADNSVALGAGSVATRSNSVAVGSAGNERQITHVANATEATDAVNLRQLQDSQQGTLRYDTHPDGRSNLSSVTLGAAGSGPTTVHNVAAGTAGTDAVNVNQLRSGLGDAMDWARNYTDQRFDSVGDSIRKVDNRASAGVASAMAIAGLPQPYEAGRSMASIAAGNFNGESGVAIGISGVSEGGRWIYKLSGSANSRGDGGVAVGAGIQW